jgi:hypothetical protein
MISVGSIEPEGILNGWNPNGRTSSNATSSNEPSVRHTTIQIGVRCGGSATDVMSAEQIAKDSRERSS